MLANQRHLFDIPDDVTYLNCAYLSPLMRQVIAAGRAGLDRKRRPWEVRAEDFWIEPNRGRELFARLINADADGVAIVPSASYGMAIAALNLPVRKGQKIIVLEDQFPSNVTHWVDLTVENEAMLETIARPEDSNWTLPLLEAIDETTAIAALPNCHWTDGSLVDLVAVGKRCREVGAALALDITQSAGAMAVDVPAIQPDFLVAAAYKWLMAPYSIGFLWVAPHHRRGRAFELGFVARAAHPHFNHLSSYEMPFNIGAHRFDVG
ncbi:MAG: aminotransferase, partial [Rhodospirillaceae bacterium]|nr:aminotransferase [Rhodospirillaceae bacterium]